MYARGGADTGRGERAAYARVALSPCLLFVRERHTLRSTVRMAERVGRCARWRASAARAAKRVVNTRSTRAGLGGGPSGTRAMSESRRTQSTRRRQKVVGWAAVAPEASYRGSGLGPQHVNPAARRPAGERTRNTCHLCGGRERPGAWQSRHSGNAA